MLPLVVFDANQRINDTKYIEVFTSDNKLLPKIFILKNALIKT